MLHSRTFFRRFCALLLFILTLLSLTACNVHFHKWEKATCTAPKTCAGCGETEGEALGHQVSGDGTCKNCSWTLPVTITLDGTDRKASSTVFGGVRLAMWRKSLDEKSGVLKNYSIFNQAGELVVEGKWDGTVSRTDYETKDPITYTEYFPLVPGDYVIKYSYYRDFLVTGNKANDYVTYTPRSELAYATCPITVK